MCPGFQNLLEHGKVVAERLAAGRRRDENDISAVSYAFNRFGLMAVKLRDAAFLQNGAQSGMHPFREGSVTARCGRPVPGGRHVFLKTLVPLQSGQPLPEGQFRFILQSMRVFP